MRVDLKVSALIGFAVIVFVLMIVTTVVAWSSDKYVDLASAWILAATLVVLLWYAFDTNRMANATSERQKREGLLPVSWSLRLISDHPRGRTMVTMSNGTMQVVKARLNLNVKVAGQPVSVGALYDGTQRWLLFPGFEQRGWFEIEGALDKASTSLATMRATVTESTRTCALTLFVEFECWDEFGQHRRLPAWPHYFDFERNQWIPSLGEQEGPAA
ncbi:MAG TPA: hypothetical protein PJ986_04080 [Gammaproteobacteria bacterium]|nr:hypothetical protein [Gammaproteobacteria bacterium]